MSTIRKILIKFNQRQQPQPSTSDSTMRTRSGFAYTIVSDESDEMEPTEEEPRSLVVRPIQPLEPIRSLVEPAERIPIARGYIQSVSMKRRSIKVLKMFGNGLFKAICSVPTVLAAIAGIHAALEFIYPPEHIIKVELNVTTKWWLW